MKKGFTLVETLAVITVIVLLGLITIPAITKSLEKNEQKVFKETIEQIVESVKIYRADYEIVDDTMSVDITKTKNIEFAKKNKILNGKVVLENSKYKVINITNGDYCANGYLDDLQITKGTCGIDFNSRYVYYQSDGKFTSLEQTTPTRSTEYKAYLKIDKYDITQIQACIYNNGEEFCLNPNEYETSKQKILDYFGYDENTWTQKGTELTSEDKACSIDYSPYEISEPYTNCYDTAVAADASSLGFVFTTDMSAEYFSCSVDGVGNAECEDY